MKFFELTSYGLLAAFLCTQSANSMLQTPEAFGEKYQALPPVVSEQTQIVYYRSTGPNLHMGPANVYVDGRYHTSLLPGGYTSFCLSPGEHTLGAFVDDMQYRGKTEGRFAAEFTGGITYYLQVDEQQQLLQPPKAVLPQQGEIEVRRTHRQVHAYSRAMNIVPCVYDREAAQTASHFMLNSDRIFTQSGGITVLSEEGLSRVNEIVVSARQLHPRLHSIVIRFDQQTDDEHLLRRKAKAIRTALTLAAIPGELIRSEFVHCVTDCSLKNAHVQILVK